MAANQIIHKIKHPGLKVGLISSDKNRKVPQEVDDNLAFRC